MDFKNKNKINIYHIKNFTLFQKNMFFIIFFNYKKNGPQRISPL